MLDKKNIQESEYVFDANLGARPPPTQNRILEYIYRIPWWAVLLAVFGILMGYAISADPVFSNIFSKLSAGIKMTLRVSITAYSMALVIGLFLGIIRSTTPTPKDDLAGNIWGLIHLAIYNIATIFVEIMRGLPILIVLLISAFVAIPEFKRFMLENYNIVIPFRGSSAETAIIGLALAYGAFLSEVFRAGIQSVNKGQIEAAKSLGMTPLQVLRLIILPQAIRSVLPPLGNDFIAMIKDSSLVAYLGIRDVTQLAKLTSGGNFMYMETYMIVAAIYLTMTILGSVATKLLERHMEAEE